MHEGQYYASDLFEVKLVYLTLSLGLVVLSLRRR